MAATQPGTSATTHVTAVKPCTPWAVNVFKSAWMPAPAELSDPAMVNATGGESSYGIGEERRGERIDKRVFRAFRSFWRGAAPALRE